VTRPSPKLLAPLLLWLLLAPAHPSPLGDQRPLRIAVASFDAHDVPKPLVAAIAELMTNLVDRPDIVLLERSQIARVMEEQRFAGSDLAQPDTARTIGTAAQADCLLVASIYKVEGTYIVAARLVDSVTGAIRLEARGSVQFQTVAEMEGQITELLRRMGLRRDAPAGPTNAAAAGSVQDLLERTGSEGRTIRMQLDPDRGVLRTGEFLSVRVESRREGFLTLLVTDADGRTGLLVPNANTGDVRIRENVPLSLPADAGFRLRVRPPLGTTRLKAIVTQRPIPVPQGADPSSAIVQLGLQDRIDASGATSPVEPWASAEVEFVVVDADAALPPTAPDPVSPPRQPAQAAPIGAAPSAAIGDACVESALDSILRQDRSRSEWACATLRWPLRVPTDWPEDSTTPPCIEWAPVPVPAAPIAVIDADFDPDDPVLAHAFARLAPATRESMRDETRRNGDPLFRHGNRVASLIAGEAPWLPSTLPGAWILPLRVTTSIDGPAWRLDRGDARGVLAALRQAMDEGCKVVNLSLSVPLTGREREAFANDPVWDDLERRGVLVVCAAGNRSEDLDTNEAPLPAALDRSNILCVGAVGVDGRLAAWPEGGSARGARRVDLLAPGERIAVSDGGGQPALADGSSYACALATGAAAAWAARFPLDRPAELVERMIEASGDTPSRGRDCRGGLLRWPAIPR
jgi:hypothetical protein